MRKYVFDQNSIFSFLSNKPIISGFKNVDMVQLNLIMLKWKVWYIFSLNDIHGSINLIIRQFPGEKISCFLSGIELDDLLFLIKQIFPQLSGEFKYWAFYILSIPLILHKTGVSRNMWTGTRVFLRDILSVQWGSHETWFFLPIFSYLKC